LGIEAADERQRGIVGDAPLIWYRSWRRILNERGPDVRRVTPGGLAGLLLPRSAPICTCLDLSVERRFGA
jgi:hypothetical protein